jgi:hypothetical protein
MISHCFASPIRRKCVCTRPDTGFNAFNHLNGHQTKLENDDSGILPEADVGDTYNARGVQSRAS